MEREPDLEAKATAILAQVESFLLIPDQVRLSQRYTRYFNDGYYLELEAISNTASSPVQSLPNNARRVHLSGIPSPTGDTSSFLELNELIDEHKIEVFTDTRHSIETASESPTLERDLLGLALGVTADDREHGIVDPNKLVILNNLFVALIGRGALLTVRQASRKHQDGTIVSAQSTDIEGSTEHLWPADINDPKTRITVKLDGSESQTVLELCRDGLIESFEEVANRAELTATYAKPEDVIRDEDGKILIVRTSGQVIRAVVAAERASGVRDLDVSQLSLIDRYVSELMAA